MKAVILDFDGVIVDSREIHRISYNRALFELGVQIGKKEFSDYFGVPSEKILSGVVKRRKIKIDFKKYHRKKNKEYLKLLWKVKPEAGSIKFIRALGKNKDCKFAIVSNTTIKEIKILLQKYKIKRYFPVVIGYRSIKKHKPNPEPYHLAAKRLHVKPKDCIAVEDSPTGVESAKRAGMYCIAVLTTNKKESLKKADLIVKGLGSKRIIEFVQKNL